MTLEKALADNTAALEALTETLQAAAAKAGGGKPAGKGKPAAKPRGKAKPKPKGPTIDTIKAEFGEYLGVKDKEVRAERIAEIEQLVAYFGVEKATDLGEEQYAEALEMLREIADGNWPEQLGDGEEEEQDDGAALV